MNILAIVLEDDDPMLKDMSCNSSCPFYVPDANWCVPIINAWDGDCPLMDADTFLFQNSERLIESMRKIVEKHDQMTAFFEEKKS